MVEHRLDRLDEDRANDGSRQEGDDQVAGERHFAGLAGQGAPDQLQEPRAEHPHHSQDGAQLDHHLEHLAVAGLEIDPVADQDEVARTGHGDEFRQAFQNAQDECLDQIERVFSHDR
ncbi:hypothetical protein G6F57_019215 [Rhizopus arrhizus]|nr:hypothetical protein G6F31_015360 [Rhizopus arrhizus]KAG1439931.1 hypothetical protein G6F57_019215 [Rhizopus arrhizus]